jgi:hypothetical protein
MTEREQELRCPECGRGVLVDVSYEMGKAGEAEPVLTPDSREVRTFSCGHEDRGPRLATSDQERLSVERRTSEETAEPIEPDLASN